jgi:hypothetical protein
LVEITKNLVRTTKQFGGYGTYQTFGWNLPNCPTKHIWLMFSQKCLVERFVVSTNSLVGAISTKLFGWPNQSASWFTVDIIDKT